MSAVAPLPNALQPPRPGMPKLWTVEEYLGLCEAGFIRPEHRVELLEGEIIEKMGQDFLHIDGVRLLVEALREVLGTGFTVDAQLPVRTSSSVSEPDVMVLRGRARDYVGRYPRPEEIVLVAEVSNTTLAGDRERKSRIYARAGFAEYWILNVADRQLETHRTPLPSGVYAEVRIYGPEEPATIDGKALSVADLLP